MKKNIAIAVLCTVITSVVLTSCPNTAGGEAPKRIKGPLVRLEDWEGLPMVDIPGGTATLADDYTPTISAFKMSKTEITQKQWTDIIGNFEYGPAGDLSNPNCPIRYVSWYAALVYCNKLSIFEGRTPCYTIIGTTDPDVWMHEESTEDWDTPPRDGFYDEWDEVICDWNANGYRLPTQAEWQYACRAGNTSTEGFVYESPATEDNFEDYEWLNQGAPQEIGKKKPNSFGLYDMGSNVCEWIWNGYSMYYDTDDTEDPTGPSDPGCGRMYYGGHYGDDEPPLCTVDSGYEGDPWVYLEIVGMRLVRRGD